MKVPENIQLIFLPPYSPELNPVEHVWGYIREQKGFNNYTFESIDALEKQLEKALREIYNEKQQIKSLCNFKWTHSAS